METNASLESILPTCLVFAITVLTVYVMGYKKPNYWKNRGFPQMDQSPLLLRFVEVLLNRRNMKNIVYETYAKMRNEKCVGFMMVMSPALLIRDPDLLRKVFVEDYSKFIDVTFPATEIEEPLLSNLNCLKGNKWKEVRGKMTHMFTLAKLKGMFDQITVCSDDMVTHIKETQGSTFEVKLLSLYYCMNVMGSVTCSLKIDAHKEAENEDTKRFIDLTNSFFKPSFKMSAKFMINSTFPKLGKLLNLKYFDDATTELYRNLVGNMIKKRKETGEQKHDYLQMMLNTRENEILNGHGGGVSTTTDTRILENSQEKNSHSQPDVNGKSKCTLPDDVITANVFVLISAGTDSASAALSFILFELAQNPTLQRRLQMEIDKSVKEGGFNYNTINSIQYLEQFINESLRLHAPIPYLDRRCNEDYVIPGTDLVIKKGDTIIFPVGAVMNDPEYWDDPETLDPDRFENPDSISGVKFAPFGLGPRYCIAMRLGKLLMKLYIVKMLMNFNLKLNARTKVPLQDGLNSVNTVEGGIWLDFEERK